MNIYTILRDRFPDAAPCELATIHARTQADADVEAKRRYPGTRLLVRCAGRARSPSSTAYRAFIASKRAAHRLLRAPFTEDRTDA